MRMRKNTRRAWAIMFLLFASGHAQEVAATTLARLSLEQMAHAADAVVRVRCVSVESRWDRGAIWTFTRFDVLETLKGNPPQRVLVRLPGGRVGTSAQISTACRDSIWATKAFSFWKKVGGSIR
jgi:hypothetical protein